VKARTTRGRADLVPPRSDRNDSDAVPAANDSLVRGRRRYGRLAVRLGLGLLVGSSCLVLGVWISWWIVPVYVGLMMGLLHDGGPSAGPRDGSTTDAMPTIQTPDPPAPTVVETAEPAGRKRRRRNRPRVDPGTGTADEAESAEISASGTTRKGRGRSRKKAAAEAPSLAVAAPARWVQVAPGSFVRVEGEAEAEPEPVAAEPVVETGPEEAGSFDSGTAWDAEPEAVASDPTEFEAPDPPEPELESGESPFEEEMRAARSDEPQAEMADASCPGSEAATIAGSGTDTTRVSSPRPATRKTVRAAAAPLSSLTRVRVAPRSGRSRTGSAGSRAPRHRGVRCARRSRGVPSPNRRRRRRRAAGGRSRSREPPAV
jgi:hypothetical protein